MGSVLRSPIASVFVIGLLARLAGQVVLNAYTAPRTWEYEVIASNLLVGHGYTFEIGGRVYVASQSSPLYIFLTAGVYLVTGHSQAVMLVLQALVGAATASLAAWLALRSCSYAAAWCAGLLVAVDPGLIVYAAELHSLTFDAFAFVGLVCATIALPHRPWGWQLAGLGVLFGLAALTRSTALVLLPVMLGWLVRYREVRLVSTGSAALVAAAVLAFAPWSVRNSLLLGQPVLVSSEASEWLWRGNNPQATGSSYTADGRLMLDAAPEDFQNRVYDADEAQRVVIYRDAALAFVRDQPLRATTLYVEKFKSFWWSSDLTGQLYPAAWRAGYLVWSAAILMLGAVGSVWGLRRQAWRADAVLLLLVLLVSAATQSLFYVEGRHRLGVEPLILVLAGVGAYVTTSLTFKSRDGSVAQDREHGARLGVDRRRMGRRGSFPR